MISVWYSGTGKVKASLLVGYEKSFGDLDVPIPELNEEKQIGREIDLKL